MKGFILYIALLGFAVLISIYFIFRHNKQINGTFNHDMFMRKFVFRIDLDEAEFFARLKMRNVNDVLDYFLNDDCSVITFKMYNVEFQYGMSVNMYNEYRVLKVEQISVMPQKSTFYINDFFIKKFDAKPLEFSKYSGG